MTSTVQSCSPNANCVNNGLTAFSQCVCKSGFTGNGLTCSPSKKINKKKLNIYIFFF